jgi:hypothetical protein
MSEGTSPPIGVPPDASVMGVSTTVMVVVVVGMAMTTVELDLTNVSDCAVDGG